MKTDPQLQHDVTAELERDAAVHAAHIGVEVRAGIVTLCGRVASYAEKLHAEAAARRVDGVRSLTVEVEVIPPTSIRRTDTDIARAAEAALQRLAYLPGQAVALTVERGWITLTGELEWMYEKQAAVAAVRLLEGVLGVSDRIALAARTSRPTDIGDAPKAALE